MAWIGRFDDFADISGFPQPRGNTNAHGSRRRQSYISNNYSDQETEDSSVNLEVDGRTAIGNISSNVQSVAIAGVVIAREGPRTIISKKGSNIERHLMCLTVRDGPMSFINATCWGGQEYANFVHSITAIGSIIEIKGAQVQEKSNPADEKFKPWTPSSCQLNVSENNGCISSYSGDGIEMFVSLLHMPPRVPHTYHSLDDIQTNGINLQGQHVNILAIVKKIWPTKDITTKTGKTTSKVDVILCDETCMAFDLTLWDSYGELAERWLPLETVIFASDVKIVYNNFKSSMAATSDSKSIFTSEPAIDEAHRLYSFAKSQYSFVTESNSETTFTDDNRDPDINSITNVLTVQEAKAVQAEVSSGQECRASFGVLYSFLSHFDVDGQEKSSLRQVCSKCRKTVQESNGYLCSNSSCADSDLPMESHVEYNFNVRFTDPTGTLDSCHLQSSVVDKLLGYKAQEFSNLSAAQKTSIKWVYLLEKTKAIIKIKKANAGNKTFVSVLDLEKVV